MKAFLTGGRSLEEQHLEAGLRLLLEGHAVRVGVTGQVVPGQVVQADHAGGGGRAVAVEGDAGLRAAGGDPRGRPRAQGGAAGAGAVGARRVGARVVGVGAGGRRGRRRDGAGGAGGGRRGHAGGHALGGRACDNVDSHCHKQS